MIGETLSMKTYKHIIPQTYDITKIKLIYFYNKIKNKYNPITD